MDKNNIQIKDSFGKLSFFFISLTLFLLFSIVPVFAASLNISVDKTKITIDEQIVITLTATGGKLSDPDIPTSDNYEIKYSGSSTQIQIMNGNTTQSQTFKYTLFPKNNGKFTFGPINAEIDGQRYSTQPVEIEVSEQSQSKDESKNAELFVTAQVSNLRPYLNQEIIYTFRFFRKVSTGNYEIKYPDFKGFWVEQLGKEREMEQNINGERYLITEVKKALYPVETGNIDIRSTGFLVEYLYREDDGFGGIFSRTRSEIKRFTTNRIKVTVKPLPPDKPAGFSGLVASQVTLSASLNQSTAKVGDSITLNLNLKGKGNVNDVKAPELNLKNNFKIYEDKPVVKSTQISDEIFSEKNYKYALVPLKEGNITIPPLKISYFNTVKKKYESINTTPFNLNVQPSDEGASQTLPDNVTQKNDVNIIGEDIFSIHEDLETLKPQGINILKKVIYFLWFLLPLMLYFATYFFRTEKFRALKNSRAKAQKSYKNYLSKINEIELNIDKNGNELPEKLSGLFKDYLINKFNISPSTINPENLSKQISSEKLPAELGKEISALFEKYEYLKFSGNSFDLNKKKEIVQSTKELLNRLELNGSQKEHGRK